MKKSSLLLITLFVVFNFQIFGQVISPSIFVNGRSGTQMTKFKDSLFYVDQLWSALYKTDGTTPPVLVKLLTALYMYGDYAANDSFFCFSRFNSGNYYVWRTDGTAAGTIPLKWSTNQYCGRFIIPVLDSLFFSGGDSIYAITQNGGKKGIRTSNLMNINDMFSYGNNLCISEQKWSGPPSEGLYAYNVLTKTTTTILNETSYLHYIHNDTLYVTATPQRYLFEIEPSTFSYTVVDSNYQIKRILGCVNNKIILDACPQGSTNYELYSFNTITRTFSLVKDIFPGTNSSNIAVDYIAQGKTKIFFLATSPLEGREPWVTDGTAVGTHMISALSTGGTSTFQNNQFCPTGSASTLAVQNSTYFLIGDTLHTNYETYDSGNKAKYYTTDGNSMWLTNILGTTNDQTPGYWQRLGDDIYFTLSYTNATQYHIYKFSDLALTTSTITYGISGIKKETFLFPNPSNGEVSINLEKEYQNIIINVSDIQGKHVYSSFDSNTNLVSIDFKAPSGVYFISITADETNVNLKMIKE